MNPTLQDCIDGRISPEIAVAHFLFAGNDAAAIRAALDEAARAAPHPRLDAIRALLLGREAAVDTLAAEVAATAGDHDASGPTAAAGIGRIAAFFDRAVRHSPEAAVALYSLGDPAILAAATAEIAEWLLAEDLLPPDADVLDLGCGIGRVAAALAPRCRSLLGLDVSAAMVAEARRRCAGFGHLRFEQTGGEDLRALPSAAFDLVLAVDSFPYLVQTGPAVVDAHFRDAARILRPRGALVVLNLSYEGSRHDRDAAPAWAAAHGFTLRADPAPFRLWDGAAFVFRR